MFFSNYLVGRKTQYLWNNFSFSFFNINIGVGQGSALSLILYLALILHIFEKCLKNLKILVFILSFIDNGLLIVQSKSLSFSNSSLFCSYDVTSLLLEKFGLTIEHGKIKVFYFSRSHGAFDPPPLYLSSLGSPILYSKDTWKYLGFIFDRKLSFCQHINFYTNKALLIVKYMKLLGNSICGLISHQKQLLYRSCILPIAFYSFQLWFIRRCLHHILSKN